MSSSVPEKEALALDAAALNRQLKLLWFACGRDDFLYQRNVEFAEILKTKGVRHEFIATDGAHSWPVWRKYLASFAPLIFR